jgi:hypothetical protein
MDLHEDIHRAIENYLDPNEFRRWLNSAIQNSRGVTFLLQKRRAKWTNFDSWYGAWQDIAKLNPVLSWGVTSRNRIVKEEDLTTLSEARVTVYGERRKEAEDAFVVPPSYSVDDILAIFALSSKTTPAKKTGTIRVQRRWVDDMLPEYELVSALRELYRGVAKIVRIAHDESGRKQCTIQPFARDCISAKIKPDLPCLPPGDALISKTYNLATGQVFSLEYATVKLDKNIAKVGQVRYGEPPAFTADPILHVSERLELSKTFLEADGYSGASLILMSSITKEMRLIPAFIEDGVPREMKIQGAIDSVGAWQFDGAVYSSETWLGVPGGRGSLLGVPASELLDSDTEFFNADPVGNREEALIVVGLTSDHRSRAITLPFGRTKDGIVYGPLMEDDSGAMVPGFLSPIWRRWPAKGGRG